MAKQQRKNMADQAIEEINTQIDNNNGQAEGVAGTSTHNEGQTEIVKLLNALQQGQEDLKISLSNQISNMKTEMISTIDVKMKAMKKTVDTEMKAMSSDIARVTARIEEIENARINPGSNPFTDDVNAGKTVVVKNLAVTPDEDEETLMQIFGTMVEAMGLNNEDVVVTRIERVNRGPQHKPKALIVTLNSSGQRTAVMKNKHKLRTSDVGDFREVFIDPWQPKHERVLQANLRLIAKAVPSLEMKGGRLVTK